MAQQVQNNYQNACAVMERENAQLLARSDIIRVRSSVSSTSCLRKD